jgi:hypothetical protein
VSVEWVLQTARVAIIWICGSGDGLEGGDSEVLLLDGKVKLIWKSLLCEARNRQGPADNVIGSRPNFTRCEV